MSSLVDPARLAALAETRLLDHPPIPHLDRYVRIAQAALAVPVALLSLVDDHRQFFSSACGLPEPWSTARETPLSHSFCQYVVATDAPLIVEDSRTDPRVRGNLAIRDLSVIAYAGMPVKTHDGFTLGSFCAIDDKPRSWTPRDLAVLEELAAAVGTEIDLRRRMRLTEQSERSLGEALEKLEAVQHVTSRTVRQQTHDLRTPLQVLQMGIESLRSHAALGTYPELHRLSDMLHRNVVHAATLAESAHAVGVPGVAERELLDVGQVLTNASTDHQSRAPRIQLRVDAPDARLHVLASPRELRRCIDNLVSNAQRFAKQQILLRAQRTHDRIEIVVEDDGPGLPSADAYQRVWAASARFHQTEGKSGTGLGLAIVRSIVEQLGGKVVAGPSALGGAAFGLELPVAG